VQAGPRTLSLTGCHFADWAIPAEGAPGIRANGGRLIVNGRDFMAAKSAISLEEGLRAAVVMGNLFRTEEPVSDASGAEVEIGLNTTE